jgi:hypothetical protein
VVNQGPAGHLSDDLVDEVETAQPDAIIWDTTRLGSRI